MKISISILFLLLITLAIKGQDKVRDNFFADNREVFSTNLKISQPDFTFNLFDGQNSFDDDNSAILDSRIIWHSNSYVNNEIPEPYYPSFYQIQSSLLLIDLPPPIR